MKDKKYNELLNEVRSNKKNHVRITDLPTDQQIEIFELLEFNTSIRNINITGEIKDPACLKFVDVLKSNRNITHLYCHNIDVSTRNFQAIMSAVGCSSISHITIQRSRANCQYRISDKKISIFASVLAVSKNIVSARLSSLDITDIEMKVLIESLEKNKTILIIRVDHIGIPVDQTGIINESIKQNRQTFVNVYTTIINLISLKTELKSIKKESDVIMLKEQIEHQNDNIDAITIEDLQIFSNQLNNYLVVNISEDYRKSIRKVILDIFIDRAISKLVSQDSYLNRLPNEVLQGIFKGISTDGLSQIAQDKNISANEVMQSINPRGNQSSVINSTSIAQTISVSTSNNIALNSPLRINTVNIHNRAI